ncbi:MAG: hypothetical protein DI566_13335 [Microbacterium sp.]|nr:MAG: hypothetical protein DI566_13335 [Microbacterium sp.]
MSKILALDAKVVPPRGQEHYWRVIRSFDSGRGEWTIRDIESLSSGESSASIREYVRRLTLAGYVAFVRDEQCGAIRRTVYRLAKTSREAPRVTRAGFELEESVSQTMWRTMKLLKSFTDASLLAALLEGGRKTTLNTVATYCRQLARAGVLSASKGAPGEGQNYRLVMAQLGPIAPKILRSKLVYDANGARFLGVAETREQP